MTWEYIAGFFDGEGSLVHNGKGFRIMIPQTNEEVLTEIKNFIGVGHIVVVKKRKPHWKNSWVYYIAKQKDILGFIRNVADHLVVKRGLSISAIPKIEVTLQRIAARTELKNKRKSIVARLRSKGLTYREIGKKMGIDFGYARRLIIS